MTKILIVEDDGFLLSMYADKFRAENFTVAVADDGDKALQVARSERPDIILLDILLPRKSGFDVLAALKQDATTKDTPVILLTNLSQKDDVDKGLALGAVDFLIKAHFMPNEVVNKVRAVLGAPRR